MKMSRKYNPAPDPSGQSIAWYNYDEGSKRYFERNSPNFKEFEKYGNQTLLDDSRNWRTKWNYDADQGYNIRHGNSMAHDGRLFTGRARANLINDDGWITHDQIGHSHKEYEILDWDAYNRDNIYSSALEKRHGKRKFETVQDILDAEEVMSGTWKATPPPPPEPPAPPKEEVFKDVLGNPVDLNSSGIGQSSNKQIGYDDFAGWMNDYLAALQPVASIQPVTPQPQPQQIGYNDFASWMGQYNAANPQPAAPPPPPQIGYNDFASWMGQYNTANPVAKPRDTFGDFMGYMKQYNMMSGPQQQAPAFGYGVGGTSLGGVAAANPYQSFANYMEQFQAPSNASPVTSSLLNI